MTEKISDAKIRQDLEELLSRYKELASSKSLKEMKEFSEANVRANFIDPLFKILGWKKDDMNEYSRESYIQDVGFADIEIKLDDETKVFVEAKRFGGIPHIKKRGDAEWTMEERQVILYAASRNCRWAVLTNFEKLRVYNALTGLTILNFESVYDLTDRFRELLYLTKHSVETGRIEKLAEKEEKPDIDIEFLKLLNNWRISLANDIYQRNRDNGVLKDDTGQLDLEKLKDAVQRILDRIVIIRWAEDNLVVDDPYLLGRKLDEWKVSPIYNSIVDALFAQRALFNKFDKIHDGKIFESGHICEQVEIGDEVLGGIIQEMNQRSFRKFDFDILGNTYETYLGNTLYLKDDGTLGLKPSMESRKESGIYYTSPYVVDYIVQNTLGELLKDKTPEEVSKIKVLDPACGSGSFLIKAYDYFKDYYEGENEKIRQQKERLIEEIRQANGSQMNFENTEAYEFKEYEGFEQEILKDNIHGVDLDRQAAEIASVNLMLKALKPGERLPPILGENIKVGNSLISGSEEDLRKYFGDEWRLKKPFNWEDEFFKLFDKTILKEECGFDIIIGNPPYISVSNLPLEDRNFLMDNYDSALKRLDIYIAFIEKGIRLLNSRGKLCFIIPYPFLNQNYAEKLRHLLLNNCVIEEIVDLSKFKIFSDAMVRNIIIIFKKENDKQVRKNFNIKITTPVDDPKLKGIIVGKTYYIPQNVFHSTPELMFRLELNETTIPLIEKINSQSLKFGKIAVVSWGARGVPVNDFHLDNPINELCKMMVKGENIGRYALNYTGKWLLYDTSKLYRPSFPLFFDNNKIILSKVTGSTGLIATFDDKKYYTDDSLNCCILKYYLEDIDLKTLRKHKLYVNEEEIKLSNKYNLKYILAFVNSRLINFYFKIILGYELNVYPESIEQLPLYPIDFSNPSEKSIHDDLVTLVDRMLSLNEQLMEFPADYWHYVNLQPHNMVALSSFIDALPANDKETLKDHFGKPLSTIKSEKFEGFELAEEGDQLIFNIAYRYKGSKGKVLSAANVKALRLRIPDEKMRKFIFYSLKDTTPGKLGRGNVLKQIYKLKIPQFVKGVEENTGVIQEVMTPFLEEVAKRKDLDNQIDKTDKTIDQMVYELYGFTEKEIAIVEESMTS